MGGGDGGLKMGGMIRSLVATAFRSLDPWIESRERRSIASRPSDGGRGGGGLPKGGLVNRSKRARDRLFPSSWIPSPGPDLNLYFFVSLLFHLILALLLYALSSTSRGAVPEERPPISVSIVDFKAQEGPKERVKPVLNKVKGKEVKRPSKIRDVEPKQAPSDEERPPTKPLPEPKAIATPTPVFPLLSQTSKPELLAETGSKVQGGPRTASQELVRGLEMAPASPLTPIEPTGPAGPKTVGGARPAPAPEGEGPSPPSEIARLDPEAGGPPSKGKGKASPKELVEGVRSGFQGPADVKVPERFVKATGSSKGKSSGLDLIDTSDPDFTEYFEKLKKRVYAAWKYPQGISGEHKVSLRFRLDQVGKAQEVTVVKSTNSKLNEGAAQAFNMASPFPPIPEKFKALVGQPLVLIFTVRVQ